MRRLNRRKRGFSLIEISVAVALLALILGGMLGIFWQGFVAEKKSQERTIAYSLAREKLEEYSRIPLPANGTITEDYGSIPEFSDFKRVINVGDYLFPGELKLITVNVYWNSDQDSQSFVTLKADY
ncbi:MAG: type II secretion system protein [Candidatus Omnitrophota bacterium]